MARKYARNYFEPWETSKSESVGPRPDPEVFPEDCRADQMAAYDRIRANADWIIRGRGMSEPGMFRSLLGKDVYHDDKGIIAVQRWLYLPDGSPDHGEIAKRICACVNAMAGVSDPEKGIKAFRELMRKLYLAESPDEVIDLKDEILKTWGLISPLEPEPAQPRC